MSDLGMMPVDWEVRFDPQRMLRERLQRAKDALNNSDLDALFIFRTEDARYLTGYRHHLGPAFIMGNAVTVLSRNHDPILWTMDFEHCKLRMPWLSPDQIRPRANFREKVGMKRWAEQVEGLIGSLAGKRVGIDIWDINMEAAIKDVFPEDDVRRRLPERADARQRNQNAGRNSVPEDGQRDHGSGAGRRHRRRCGRGSRNAKFWGSSGAR